MVLDFLTVGKIYIETIYKVKNNHIYKIKERITGECLHTAINGSFLGAKTGIMASVGKDSYGITDLLETYKVDYSDLILSKKRTGRIIHLNKEYIFEGANELLELDSAVLKKTKIIHISDDRELAEKLVNMDKKPFLTSTLDVKADIIFSEEEGPGKRIILGDKITFEKGNFDVTITKENRAAFIAGFLTQYAKTQKLKPSIQYAISAVDKCKKRRKGGSHG